LQECSFSIYKIFLSLPPVHFDDCFLVLISLPGQSCASERVSQHWGIINAGGTSHSPLLYQIVAMIAMKALKNLRALRWFLRAGAANSPPPFVST
jgi:hypothetical protein